MRQKSLRFLVWQKSQGICFLCGQQMMPDETYGQELSFTVEHLLPKARGGTNDIDNLYGAHQFCNQYKNNATIEELPREFKKFLRWKIKNLWIHKGPKS